MLGFPMDNKFPSDIKAIISIYTDGSCHTQLKIGAWAAIILVGDEKNILTGKAAETTHQRMELTAVIEALNYVEINHPAAKNIRLVSDSQYVIGLPAREQKLAASSFTTRQGNPVQNADLVKQLFAVLRHMDVRFEKIRAHQKITGKDDYNIEADKLSRSLVRAEATKY